MGQSKIAWTLSLERSAMRWIDDKAIDGFVVPR